MVMARTAIVSLLFAALTSICFAQAPVPGTFSTAPVEPYGGLIVNAPMMSLGNGLTPPVVNNQPTVVVATPAGTATSSAVASYAMPPTTAVAVTEGASTTTAAASPANEDMVYPTSETSLSGATTDTRSLGEIAQALRQQQADRNSHVYTNSDLTRLNKPPMPGGESQAEQNEQAQPQQPAQRPHQYSVPVGSKPPEDVVPSKHPTQAPPPHSGNPFEPKVRSTDQQEGPTSIPRTASLLPLLGAIGGSLVGIGLIYRNLRG
jgi:hypothetical protein